MRRVWTAAAAAAVIAAPAAQAGVYGDDLGKCLVQTASPEDQRALIVWLFAAISAHPDVKATSSLSDAQRDEQARKAGLLFQRLMTVDCRKETVAALKYEGSGAIESGFATLGQVAMRGLMSHPAVEAGMAKLTTDLDEKAFENLAAEAGIPVRK